MHQRKAIALRAAMDDLLALCEERGYVDLNDPRWHDAYQLCARPHPPTERISRGEAIQRIVLLSKEGKP